jgi:hypothetical protein
MRSKRRKRSKSCKSEDARQCAAARNLVAVTACCCRCHAKPVSSSYRMRYGQFWQAEGWKLMEVGVREPELTAAFEKWKAAGSAEFTIPRIKRWRRTSEGIARSEAPEAFRTYCGVDRKFRPLEQDVVKAVVDYDERINAEIHDRRLRAARKK